LKIEEWTNCFKNMRCKMKTRSILFLIFICSILSYAGIGVRYSPSGSLPVELISFTANISE
jgi:hypothetical protein